MKFNTYKAINSILCCLLLILGIRDVYADIKSSEKIIPKIKANHQFLSGENKNKIVILHNHGTTRPDIKEKCDEFIPDAIQFLSSLDNVNVYYLCSEATEGIHFGLPGKYIYRRLEEIESILDNLLLVGYAAKNIFLSGQSAGGWTSLMAEHLFPDKFNGVLAFAPAFAGTREERNSFSLIPWFKLSRTYQKKEMLTASKIRALVFAYDGDPFERPEDLIFLVENYPNSVNLISYSCEKVPPHYTATNDCKLENTITQIQKFIADRAIGN